MAALGDVPKGFSLRIQEVLAEKGWNQREAARATRGAVSFTGLNEWIMETAGWPRSRQLYALAQAAGVTVDWLLDGSEPKYRVRQSPPSAAGLRRAQEALHAVHQCVTGEQDRLAEEMVAATKAGDARAVRAAENSHPATQAPHQKTRKRAGPK